MSYLKPLGITLFFVLSYFAGCLAAARFPPKTSAPSASDAVSSAIVPAAENWGLSFQEEGKPPVANATFEELRKYDAYYAEDTDEKRIYLTFDCGYENGNTEALLDALKKHKASATFFVVGNFISTSPELVKRMHKDGHTEDLYKEITGEEMVKYYRPPQGKYSTENLQMAKDMGYHTFFWSLAYVDWYQDNQPSHDEAFDKLLGRIHPGAIVLLHSTSSTNAEILDELLGKWEEMGYTFHGLEELVG